MPYSGIGEWTLYTGSFFAGNAVFSAAREAQPIFGEERRKAKWKASKKYSGNFACLSGVLIEQSVSRGQNRKFFCGKMLDGGVEKAHKAVRANELATPKGRREKNFSRMAKKFLTRV